MTHTIKFFKRCGTMARRSGLTAAIFLAGVVFLPLSSLYAIFNGQPALVELGQPSMGQGNPNTVTGFGFGQPQNIAIGGGRVYIADPNNNRVLWWTLNTGNSGNGIMLAAAGVLGQADLTSSLANRGGLAGPNTLSAPNGVAVDVTNNVIWVADTGNNRVLRFPGAVASGGSANLALGQPDLFSSAFNVSQTALSLPAGVAVDGPGNVWVADSGNNRVLRFNLPGVLNGPPAVVVLGQANYTANAAAASAAGLNSPFSVAIAASGNIWVADSGNNRVLEYNSPGTSSVSADFVLGQAVLTSTSPNRGLVAPANNTMSSPLGVGVSGTDVWVADTANNRVLKFLNPLAGAPGQAANLQLGQADFLTATPNRGLGIPANNTLNTPSGVALSGTDVWVVDGLNYRVLRFPAAAPASDLLLGQKDFLEYAANTLRANSLYSPNGVAVSGAGIVYAADYNNNRVLFWNSVTAFTSGSPADGVIGQADFTSMLPNRGLAAPANNTLSAPYSVAVTGNDLWVNDLGNYRLLHYTAPGVLGAAADQALGQNDLISGGANGPSSATVSGASGMTIDGSGRLWVADSGNHRVLRFSNLATGSAADIVLGQADFVSGQANRTTGNPPTSLTLSFPSGVAVDAANNVWVADSDNNRVVHYAAPVSSGMAADIELGQTPVSFTTAVSSASRSTLNAPGAVAIGAAGSIWVADSFNSRVLRFDAPLASAMNAGLVMGQADFPGSFANRGSVAPAANTLSSPNAIYPTASALWVADTGNNRVLKGALDTTTSLSPAFTAISSSALTAAWTPVSGAQYVVVFSSTSNFTPYISSGPVGAATAGFSGLNPSTSYYLEVKLSTEPDATYAINFAVAQTSPSVTALSPVLTAVSSTSLTASWNALTGVSYLYKFSAASNFSTIISSGVQLPPTLTFNGLNPNTNYYLAVALSTEAATALSANTVQGRTSPIPATLLGPVASAITGSGFTVSWTDTGAQYVAVLSSDTAFTRIISSGALTGGTSVYTGLAEYTTYYFEVKVATEADAAYAFNTLAVRTAPLHAALSPAFTGATSGTLTASWTTVGASNYTVVFSSTSNFSVIMSSVTQSSSTASFAQLTPDTSYYLEVKLSADPAAAFGINKATGHTRSLGTSLGIAINANSANTISVTWPFYPATKYVVVLATDAFYTNIVSSFTTGAGEYSEVFTGLNGLTSYYYEMKLSTESDAGYASNTATVFTPATQLFPNPTAPTVSGFTISWSTVTGKNYAVVLAHDAGFTNIVSSTTQSTVTKNFTGLASGVMYYFAVKLTDESDLAYADLANRGAQTTLPANLLPTLTAVSSSSLTASWNPVGGIGGGSYVAVLASDPGYMMIVASGTLATNTITYTGLAPYTTYYFEMKLASQSDLVFPANTAAAQTLPSGTSLSPTLTALSSSTIQAGWTAVANASYTVVLASDPGFATIISSATQPAASQLFTGLSGAVTYYFAVKLSTESDLSCILNTLVGATSPTRLVPVMSAPSAGTLNVSWASVPGAYYTAQLAMDPGFTRVVSTATTESPFARFTGLIGNLPYYLRVRLSGDGMGAYAVNLASATPPAGSLKVYGVNPNPGISGSAPIGLTISGAGIPFGPSITLMQAGQPDVIADNIIWQSPSQILATVHQPFALGQWTVIVAGPVEATALPNGFTLTDVRPSTLVADPGSAKIFQGIFKPKQGQSAQLATSLTVGGSVTIRVYDTMGRLVREMFDGSRGPGNYMDPWNGRNDGGSMAASGVYLIRFEAPEFKTTKRVVLVK